MRTEQFNHGILIVGFLALGAATLIAHFNPATGYELSIYTGTPITVWIGVCLSLFIALGLAFSTEETIQRLALFLAGNSFLVIVMLPLLRGYYHLGEGDTMSHVGFVKDLSAGILSPMDIGYPAVHLIALSITEIMEIPITQAFYYIAYIFIAIFVVFLPLTIRLLTTSRITLSISVFAAILLLPINLISAHMHIHPSSQATLFVIFLLYIFSFYIKSSDHRSVIIFPLASFALLLLHPQQAANFLLLLGTAAIVQITPGLIKDNEVLRKRTVYIQAGFFMIIFWLWFAGSRFVGSFTNFLVGLFRASQSAEEVSQRGTSLSAIGSGPEELFVKLFLVSFIFCLIAAGYIIFILISSFLQKDSTNNEVMIYLIAGLFPISFLFIMYIIANVTTQYFRHLGFIMVIITVIGSIGLGRFVEGISPTERTTRIIVISLFTVFLTLSLLVIYPSPYIYQDTGHVPEGQVTGYENAFIHQNGATDFVWLRSNVERYDDFHSGTTTSSVEGERAPYHFADQDLATHYTEPKYLVVTSKDRAVDVGLYDGFRYSRNDLHYLQTHSTISRVRSTGNLELYVVNVNEQDRREANNHISQNGESGRNR